MNKAKLIEALASYPDDIEILVPEGMDGIAAKIEVTEGFAAPSPTTTRNGFAFWESGVDQAPEFYPDNDPNGTRPVLAVMLRRTWE